MDSSRANTSLPTSGSGGRYRYRGAQPMGRPALGGKRYTLIIGPDLTAEIDRRTGEAIRACTPRMEARPRTIRVMLREGAAVQAAGAVVPLGFPRRGRDGSAETFTLDRDTVETVTRLAVGGPYAPVVRGLLVLSAEYSGPALGVYPWVALYEAALALATPGEAVALAARIAWPEALGREVAEGVGLSVASYKSRVARALRRVQ